VVDVVCLDKTGTLTEPRPRVVEAVSAQGVERARLEEALARNGAAARSRTATLEAIADTYHGEPEAPEAEVPFSSRNKRSAVQVHGRAYVLGAPELFELDGLASDAEAEARRGRRVVAIAAEVGIPADAVVGRITPEASARSWSSSAAKAASSR
jgi:cation-transporting ATPase E